MQNWSITITPEVNSINWSPVSCIPLTLCAFLVRMSETFTTITALSTSKWRSGVPASHVPYQNHWARVSYIPRTLYNLVPHGTNLRRALSSTLLHGRSQYLPTLIGLNQPKYSICPLHILIADLFRIMHAILLSFLNQGKFYSFLISTWYWGPQSILDLVEHIFPEIQKSQGAEINVELRWRCTHALQANCLTDDLEGSLWANNLVCDLAPFISLHMEMELWSINSIPSFGTVRMMRSRSQHTFPLWKTSSIHKNSLYSDIVTSRPHTELILPMFDHALR